jgi:hypothetical protein
VVVVVTVIVKEVSEADASPSVTLIVMGEVVPDVPAGVPEIPPVWVLKVAQAGSPVTLNMSLSPSTSAALGWKMYDVPAATLVAGLPEIVGAVLGPPCVDGLGAPSFSLDDFESSKLQAASARLVATARNP